MSKSNKQFVGVLLVSVFIHILIYFVHGLIQSESPYSKSVDRSQVIVKLKSKSSPVPEQQDDTPPPKQKEEQEVAPEPEPIIQEVPDLPDSYKAGDEAESLASPENNTDKGTPAQVTGERAKVLKNKSLQAKKKTEQFGAIGTVAEKEGIKVSDPEEEVADEVLEGSLYDLGESDDEEIVDSAGKDEVGVESSTSVEFASELNEITFNEVGNTTLLSDSQLSDSFVKDPLSEKRSKEVRVINGYLKEVVSLFEERWENPLTPAERASSTFVRVRFSVSLDGYIRDPYIYLQSDFPVLDNSVVAVLKQLQSHKLSWHKSYLEKYRYFTLSWTGSGRSYELMPFESE